LTVVSFVSTKTYAQPGQGALPDVDGALLVLMGAAQGAYIGGKLVSSEAAAPKIEHILPSEAPAGETVSVLGNFFGEGMEGDSIIFVNQAGMEHPVPYDPNNPNIPEWTDTRIKFIVPALPQGTYNVRVRSNSQTGESREFRIT